MMVLMTIRVKRCSLRLNPSRLTSKRLFAPVGQHSAGVFLFGNIGAIIQAIAGIAACVRKVDV